MNDVRPPRRPDVVPVDPVQNVQPRQPEASVPPSPLLSDVSLDLTTTGGLNGTDGRRPRRNWKFWTLIVVAVISTICVVAMTIGYFWYKQAVAPVSNNRNDSRVSITIEAGTTPGQIGQQLEDSKLIRSNVAFDIYTRITKTQHKLQAGSYRLSPSESTAEIVDHLLAGNVDSVSIMFYPGATLRDTTATAQDKKVDVMSVLKRAGYSEAEINAAFNKEYDHPVFKDKPAMADLEGYVYGQTYEFSSNASVEDVLKRTFDELYAQVVDKKLEQGFKAQGLTLHQGIILSSIVQREVPDASAQDRADQKVVAGIFYNRLKDGMQLGSDVTYHYIADKTGVARDHTLDSPYNTRRVTGLTPGPIAAPGIHALVATAYPVKTDYIYFLSGDDDKTYFGVTNDDHEANIRNHCAYKCSLP